MISLGFTAVSNSFAFNVTGPRDASIMPLGQYMLFVLSDGIPSTAVWVTLAWDLVVRCPLRLLVSCGVEEQSNIALILGYNFRDHI
jgi:hypothetical protein